MPSRTWSRPRPGMVMKTGRPSGRNRRVYRFITGPPVCLYKYTAKDPPQPPGRVKSWSGSGACHAAPLPSHQARREILPPPLNAGGAIPYTPCMRPLCDSTPTPASGLPGRKLPTLLGACAACLVLLAGCIVSPAPSATATDAGLGADSDPNLRSKSDTETGKVPRCVRVWNHAAADSTWHCPDPRPPAPVQGRSG